MNEFMYNVSSGPHIRQDLNTGSVMRNVCVALLPATVFGVFHFGLRAFLIIVCSIAAAELSELIFNRIAGKKNSLSDWSAVVTGLLLALSLLGENDSPSCERRQPRANALPSPS